LLAASVCDTVEVGLSRSPKVIAVIGQVSTHARHKRQKLTAEVLTKVKAKLLPEAVEKPLLMVGGHDYPPGVSGVVGRQAGR
jgi:hypothetical protein